MKKVFAYSSLSAVCLLRATAVLRAAGGLSYPPTGDNSPTYIIFGVLGLAFVTFIVVLILMIRRHKKQ